MKKLDITKIIIVFTMLLWFAYQTNAQSVDRKWAVGAYGSILEYKGTLGNEWFSFDFDEVRVRGGVSLARYISPSFDLIGRFTIGELDHEGEEGGDFEVDRFHTFAVIGDLNLVYKFTNGYILPEDFIVSPFVTAGLGGNYFAASGWSTQWGSAGKAKRVVTPLDTYAGLGFKFFPAAKASIILQTGLHMPLSDRVDMEGVEGSDIDMVWEHNLGVAVNILTPADEDGDGVPDHRDYCPETPEGVDVDRHGCAMDSDGDGVADFEDDCPYEPGLIRHNGCPDMDNDGIMDSEDECPDVPGIKKWNGCPDTDGDAIIDKDDDCPDVAGPLEMNGCPCDYKPTEWCGDQDQDGVSDLKDECPDTPAGVEVDEKGCPLDTDGDGVPDYEDKCPDTPGTGKTGCPGDIGGPGAINIENVNFKTASDVLLPTSFETLDKIVTVLKENVQYNLNIEGHCDSNGPDAYNQGLSERRAKSAKEYLVKKGVSADRIASKGFGEKNPMATNSTPEGRQLNRRVEFKLFLP